MLLFQDLDKRYNAMLQMYGEKVEEADELRLDLQDVKDMYKGQVMETMECCYMCFCVFGYFVRNYDITIYCLLRYPVNI